MSRSEETESGWNCVDPRPFECPNGHGLLEVESSTSVYCPQCDYSRVVFEPTEVDN